MILVFELKIARVHLLPNAPPDPFSYNSARERWPRSRTLARFVDEGHLSGEPL